MMKTSGSMGTRNRLKKSKNNKGDEAHDYGLATTSFAVRVQMILKIILHKEPEWKFLFNPVQKHLDIGSRPVFYE